MSNHFSYVLHIIMRWLAKKMIHGEAADIKTTEFKIVYWWKLHQYTWHITLRQKNYVKSCPHRSDHRAHLCLSVYIIYNILTPYCVMTIISIIWVLRAQHDTFLYFTEFYDVPNWLIFNTSKIIEWRKMLRRNLRFRPYRAASMQWLQTFAVHKCIS